jgi:hypothetical protein
MATKTLKNTYKRKKFNAYIIVKSRKGETEQYLKTTQCFVDDIYDAKFYKNLEEAQKDRNTASFYDDLYMLMLHQPKYNFEIVRI